MNFNFYKNKKVFITGHTGFKGSWMSLWLKSKGAIVCGYSQEPPTNPSLFQLLDLEKSLDNHIIGDVRNLDLLSQSIYEFQPEIVFHLAAQPLVRDSYKIPVETYSTNVMGTVNLLESVRLSKSVRSFVNITTDKVYENKEWCWSYRENEPFGGHDPYSNSKACSELVTQSYRSSYFPVDKYSDHRVGIATARAGNVIGGGDFANERLIPDIIRAIFNQEKVQIRNPNSIRPWQHVLEPLSGYLILGQKLYEGELISEGWNFGPYEQDAKPVIEIVKQFQQICQRLNLWKVEYEIDSNQHVHEANYLKLDISKVKQRLNWTPTWNLNHALEKIIEWTKIYYQKEDVKQICLNQIHEYEMAKKELK